MRGRTEIRGATRLVLTPAFSFPIEPHFALPFIHWFAPQIQAKLLRVLPHHGAADLSDIGKARREVEANHILTASEFHFLFTDTNIIRERILGMTKSYTATWGLIGPQITNGTSSRSAMKVLSLCCVRDENDILEETLLSALLWSDRIFVFDDASTDGTTETLQRLAREHHEIVLVGRQSRGYSEELRGEIFEQYRGLATDGDWWCKLDADEIYVDDVKAVLRQIPQRYGFVQSETYLLFY